MFVTIPVFLSACSVCRLAQQTIARPLRPPGGSSAFNSMLFEEQTATLMAVMGLNDPLVAEGGSLDVPFRPQLKIPIFLWINSARV